MIFKLLNREIYIDDQKLKYFASDISEIRFVRYVEHFYGCLEVEAKEIIELMEQTDLENLIGGRIDSENKLATRLDPNECICYKRMDGSVEKLYF